MSCRDRVLDVFVTRDEYDYDETWQAPVWSIELRTVAGATVAAIVNQNTDWIMQADYDTDLTLEVGDTVRIGATSGYTDYSTVLQKVRVADMMRDVQNPAGTAIVVNFASTVTFTDPAAPKLIGAAPAAIGKDMFCYRLSTSQNLTLPPEYLYQTDAQLLAARATIAYDVHTSWATTTARRLAYPLFKINRWLDGNGKIRCNLDHGIKGIHWIKLCGYSVVNKQHAGFHTAHELPADDWIAMHIDEIQGRVVSNNRHANGAFCVLHMGGHEHNEYGTVEYHKWDREGLCTHTMDGESTVRSLDLRFVDRKGAPAHFGRIHLWFKLMVAHG